MEIKVFMYLGERKVDVKLHRIFPGVEDGQGGFVEGGVFWTGQRWREERGRLEPAGGCNSFVLVEASTRTGGFSFGGQAVDLAAVNGIGEVRWTVDGPKSYNVCDREAYAAFTKHGLTYCE